MFLVAVSIVLLVQTFVANCVETCWDWDWLAALCVFTCCPSSSSLVTPPSCGCDQWTLEHRRTVVLSCCIGCQQLRAAHEGLGTEWQSCQRIGKCHGLKWWSGLDESCLCLAVSFGVLLYLTVSHSVLQVLQMNMYRMIIFQGSKDSILHWVFGVPCANKRLGKMQIPWFHHATGSHCLEDINA